MFHICARQVGKPVFLQEAPYTLLAAEEGLAIQNGWAASSKVHHGYSRGTLLDEIIWQIANAQPASILLSY